MLSNFAQAHQKTVLTHHSCRTAVGDARTWGNVFSEPGCVGQQTQFAWHMCTLSRLKLRHGPCRLIILSLTIQQRSTNVRNVLFKKNCLIFLTTCGCTPHDLPSRNFTLNSMLTLQCFHIGVWHILMCADVYPIVALKCVLRIRRYQIPHETHFFLASFGCTPHYIPSKNFRFSSILTLQCFHMLRFIFMWTFMSSCSRVPTTHAARLPSRLFCPLGIWSAELVAL